MEIGGWRDFQRPGTSLLFRFLIHCKNVDLQVVLKISLWLKTAPSCLLVHIIRQHYTLVYTHPTDWGGGGCLLHRYWRSPLGT